MIYKAIKIAGGIGVVIFVVLVSLFIYYNKESKLLDEKVRNASEGKFIRLSHGYVHYELAGNSTQPIIILIHGAGSGYYAWDKNFNTLVKAGFHVLRYDLYGRGLSDRPDKKYDLELFAAQLHELTDSLRLNPPYHLISVSMGAMIAIEEANKNSDKIGKVIFIDPAAIDKGEANAILKTPILSELMMTIYWAPRAVEKQMKEFHNPVKVNEYAAKSEVQLQYKGFRKAMLSTWLNTSNKNMDKELEEMGKHKKDILLIWGKNDPLTSIKSSVKYKKYIPHIQYAEVDKAGHLSNYEQPDSVNTLMIDFLKN